MFGLSFQEFIVVGIVAILLFGKRLPDVAKSLGNSYREFRKGLADIQSSLNYSDSSTYRSSTYSSSYASPKSSSGGGSSDYDDYDEPTAPKFEPPQSAPRTSGEDTAADSANAGSESAA